MTRKSWRTLAADVQTLAQCGRLSRAALMLRERLGCRIAVAWWAVQKLRDLPEVKR